MLAFTTHLWRRLMALCAALCASGAEAAPAPPHTPLSPPRTAWNLIDIDAPSPAADAGPTPAKPALPDSVRRLCALASERGLTLPSALVESLGEVAALLAFLPMERLVDLELRPKRLVLVFDTQREREVEVRLPSTTCFVLDERAAHDDVLRSGRPRRVVTDEHRLVVHRRVELELGAEGIVGVRAGDLELAKGPFRFDVAVSVTKAPGRMNVDEDGRPVLALDDQGRPFRRDGQWVVERFDKWIVLKAFGRKVEIGVPGRAPPK
ncbi:MAG: hypothetical protein HZA53_14180 [Planctomycetes bacterium]|nr:hypothetical protein [Planctomycetota bacterium]